MPKTKAKGQPRRSLHRPCSVRCPTCDGTGKIDKARIQQTKYVWTPKGAKKQRKGKWKKATSFLTITTFTAPNVQAQGRRA